MVIIVTKKINKKEYLYLVESIREKNKIIQKTIKYIGKKRPILKEEFECMQSSYKNEDWILSDFSDKLSYQDHEMMKKASKDYKEYLQNIDPMSFEKERERFLSIFISNSNAIEGSTMTAKDTFDYLFNDIIPKNKSKKELFMAQNLLDAWAYLENNYKKFPGKEDLLELHLRVNRGIESEKTLGKYKVIQNYVGDICTTSYLFTEEKMKKLLEWIKTAFKEVNDFEVAFQSHAQFEIIHPFIDGNGRVGRLLINWLLMYKGLSPLAIKIKKRSDYIFALENSRKGKIESICKFCFKEYLEQYRFI
jgi:Fic family protein